MVGLAVVAAVWLRRRPAPDDGRGSLAVAPAYPVVGADAVEAEVLNGAGRSGLARAVTLLLRSRGVDVVFYGDTDSAPTTRVLARRGDVAAAREVLRALGDGEVAVEADSLRYVDVTVILGHDFDAELPFRP